MDITEEIILQIFVYYELLKIYLIKLKFYIEWGCFDCEDIIEDEKLYNWFYCSDNLDILLW